MVFLRRLGLFACFCFLFILIVSITTNTKIVMNTRPNMEAYSKKAMKLPSIDSPTFYPFHSKLACRYGIGLLAASDGVYLPQAT